MKRKNLLALAIAALTVFNTVTVYASPVTAAPEAASVDEQYPLRHLADWFVVNKAGELTTKWDFDYLWIDLGMEHGAIQNYLIENAMRDKNPNYLNLPSLYDMLVIAKLAGVPMTGYEHMANEPEILRLETEIRLFLNSFDWKKASDLEKASQVAKRIAKADYNDNYRDNYENFLSASSYPCLVDGVAECSGYTGTANTLSFCIGLPALSCGRLAINHTYPVFLVNGVWLAYEPTGKTDYFTIVDYRENIEVMQDGSTYPGGFARYCIRSGYEAPKDITGIFPQIRTTYYSDIVTEKDWKVQVVPFQ